MSDLTIQTLTADQSRDLGPELIGLLKDSVDNGASVGFLPPLDLHEAQTYWTGVISEVAQGKCVLLAAFLDQTLAGAVQLALAGKANALHRAEVQKLMVHSQFRQRGIGKTLMLEIEKAARADNRTLLVLDTRQGDAAEQLYRKLGYVVAGTIPQYARSASGALHETVFFFRLL